MTTSRRDAGSSVHVAVPVPLKRAERNTQPSVARVNVNSALGSEIDEAVSSSATKLFRLFSRGDAKVNWALHPTAQRRSAKRPEALGVTLMGSRPSLGAFRRSRDASPL